MKKRIIIPSLVALLTCSCTITSLSVSSNEDSSTSSASSQEPISSSGSQEESSSSIHALLDDYSLYWSDEFEGTSLGSSWEAQIGDGTNYSVYRWGNNEDQYYKKENASVSGGLLHIVAKKEETSYRTEDNEVRTYHYTSARLRTTGRITTTYGYIESRIKLPAGTGLWPAFWMLPEENFEGKWWPTNGEIDIMEAKGRILNKYGATIHTGTSNGQDYYKNKDYTFLSTEGDITDFHNYGVEWSTAGFTFYIDGYAFFSVTPYQYQNSNGLYAVSETAPFDRPFHILLNLAVGGNYDNGRVPEDNFSQAEMLVDYVRIYHKN